MITIYEYITSNNPYEARALLNKYGISLQGATDNVDVANLLEQGVKQIGEPLFLDIVSLHPDKQLLEEVSGRIITAPSSEQGEKKCSCQEKSKSIADYVNTASSNNFLMQHGQIILISALVIGIAIVASSKS